MPRNSVKALHLLLAALTLAVSAGAQSQPPIQRAKGGETVDVEIKMIPFYAVDAKGQPVYDLRQDEVELRVGGKPISLDTLDGYPMTSTPTRRPEGRPKSVAGKGTSPSRHVIFLVDSAFSSPTGFRNARVVADRLLEDVPAGDRLYLLTHSAAKGLESKLGATPADEKGKARLRGRAPEARPRGEPPVDRRGAGPAARRAGQGRRAQYRRADRRSSRARPTACRHSAAASTRGSPASSPAPSTTPRPICGGCPVPSCSSSSGRASTVRSSSEATWVRSREAQPRHRSEGSGSAAS